jgi:hypothetical protein
MNLSTHRFFTFCSTCCTLALSSIIISACSEKDQATDTEPTVTHVCRVAVLLEDEDLPQWQKTAAWALHNLSEAQKGMSKRVELQLEFKDQNAADIDEYMQRIANDTTIHAIIGPCTSQLARDMAITLGKVIEQNPQKAAYRKPMISPMATNVEYQRVFSDKDYVWNMAECDITQLEILIATIARQSLSPIRTITLLAPTEADDLVENHSAYIDWFGFIAEEYGLEIKGVLPYKNTDELREHVRSLPSDDIQMKFNSVIFVPSSVNDALALDEELTRLLQSDKTKDLCFPRFYCSDLFITPSIAKNLSNDSEVSYEGIDLSAWPESGFSQAYRQHFSSEMMNGEAQFYDALCLVAFADMLSQHTGLSLIQSIRSVTTGNNGTAWGCYTDGMRQIFSQLQQGVSPSIYGASGRWLFDPNTHTNHFHSTYRHWRYYQGSFITLGYATSESTNHSISSQDPWQWTASKIDYFEDDTPEITYPPLSDRWALLVAGSTGWRNYRFQSDVFAMYQILRQHGYDDDHIVLIANDDIANSKSNTNDPGAIRINEAGDNLYTPSAIDYHLDDITQTDMANILQGKSSDRLPRVISSTPNDNIYIFWSSHGTPGSLDFGDQRSIRYTTIQDILADTPHHKMFVCVEACYAGGLGQQCQNLPGTLFLTSASPYEESHASGWSNQIGVYLTNYFTDRFQETILLNPHISMRNLYYSLARSVSGSHVKLYNTKNYGNVYQETMEEYLK